MDDKRVCWIRGMRVRSWTDGRIYMVLSWNRFNHSLAVAEELSENPLNLGQISQFRLPAIAREHQELFHESLKLTEGLQ